ncbi:MAG TPA: POTRA domain-containing protein [Candidatus Sulfotelmatobacter sp.]|nr:POTRA domain-containing protein [Candidatus Sulfotelmatobacter sp.]
MRSSVVIFCFFSAALLKAQLAPKAPQAAYEGQNVSAVSLIANPHRNLEPLYPLVQQKAGALYSEDQIKQSIEALQKAGGFPEVRASVDPDVTGLRVSFLLEPAYYLGVIDFPGAVKRFSYTTLLQVVNLQDEDPYDPARLPIAQDALLNFFHQNGYFQAKVHAEPKIDDEHQLVSVVFVVETGKQARISSVTLDGPGQPENSRLLRAVRSLRARLSGGLLKAGMPYSRERLNEASTLLKRALAGQRRLASSVKENPPEYDPVKNRVAVSFKIEVGPVVTVRTAGARLSSIPFLGGRQMRKLVPIYSEGTIDRDLVEEGRRNLIDYFQKKGFSDVKVTTEFQKKPDEILVVYNIDRGRKHKVDRILFHGNYAIPEKDLLDQMSIKKSHVWTHGAVSDKLAKKSKENIEALYHDRGYEEVKVTSHTVDREGKIDVIFEIEEGPQTLVEHIEVAGNQHVTYNALTAPKGFQLRAGVPFSQRKLTEDRNRIQATYLNRGYLNAEVKTTVDQLFNDPHRVYITYAIAEHQLVRVSQVVYLGQKQTRTSLMAQTSKIPAESPMRRAQLLEAESRLYDLNVFDWASVGPRKPITDQTDEMALVKVHEAKRNELTYGFGFEISHRGGNIPTGTVAVPGGGGTIGLNGNKIAPSQSTFASPRGVLEYTRRNMRGLAETASASLLLSRLDQRILTTYGQPHFLSSQWQSLTSFSIERNSENPLFTAGLGDLSFEVERLISTKTNTRLQLRYDFNKTNLSHILVPQLVLDRDRSVRLSTVSATIIRDTRDKPLDAHRGVFSTINLGITPTAFGSSANFAKLFAQYAYFKPVHSIVFANSIRLGLASRFAGSFVPTSQLFFSGGGTSLRGFPIDEAGPQRLVPFCNVLQGQSGCVNVTVPVGGRQLFILNSEARFPLHITKALGGVVFYDGGNVYSAINLQNFINNYTNTVGVGLRYATPIGPIRFDVGRNLNPVPGINPLQYYITVGQAF